VPGVTHAGFNCDFAFYNVRFGSLVTRKANTVDSAINSVAIGVVDAGIPANWLAKKVGRCQVCNRQYNYKPQDHSRQ
jgi:hypothetical protein